MSVEYELERLDASRPMGRTGFANERIDSLVDARECVDLARMPDESGMSPDPTIDDIIESLVRQSEKFQSATVNASQPAHNDAKHVVGEGVLESWILTKIQRLRYPAGRKLEHTASFLALGLAFLTSSKTLPRMDRNSIVPCPNHAQQSTVLGALT